MTYMLPNLEFHIVLILPPPAPSLPLKRLVCKLQFQTREFALLKSHVENAKEMEVGKNLRSGRGMG
jgi:hypothetical protein